MPSPSSSTAAPSGSVFVRSGRGGAGNYYVPTDAAAAEEQQNKEDSGAQDTASTVSAAVGRSASVVKPKPTGLSGRGGVGNWTDTSVPSVQEQEEERKKVEHLEMKVLHDVEAGLAMPPRTYHQHDREMEK
jgi:hypothetical protein